MRKLLRNVTRNILPVMPDAVGARRAVPLQELQNFRDNRQGHLRNSVHEKEFLFFEKSLVTKAIFLLQTILLIALTGSLVQAETAQEKMALLVSNAGADSVVAGKDGWLFLKEELEQLSSPVLSGQGIEQFSKATKKEYADPVPAIIDFNKQLAERGIDLLFVLIPPKALIYSDMLPESFSQNQVTELEQPYLDLFATLTEQGIGVLDLIPLFTEQRKDVQLYCKTDSHFSGAGVKTVARKAAAYIMAAEWYKGLPKKEYVSKQKEVSIHGDLAEMTGDTNATESLPLSFVMKKDDNSAVIANPASPVLLLGDSHTLVFSVGNDMHTSGAGLFDHLALEIGFPVDRIGVRGSGATPSRIKLYQRSRKEPDFLKNKKTVIWCLSARELTGPGGWRKIPVAKK